MFCVCFHLKLTLRISKFRIIKSHTSRWSWRIKTSLKDLTKYNFKLVHIIYYTSIYSLLFNPWDFLMGVDMQMCHSLTLRWQRSTLTARPIWKRNSSLLPKGSWVVHSLRHPRERTLGTRLSRSRSLRKHQPTVDSWQFVRYRYILASRSFSSNMAKKERLR